MENSAERYPVTGRVSWLKLSHVKRTGGAEGEVERKERKWERVSVETLGSLAAALKSADQGVEESKVAFAERE